LIFEGLECPLDATCAHRMRADDGRKGNEGGGKFADCLVSTEKRHERR